MGEQLKMFMTPQEIIDTTHKVDSQHSPMHSDTPGTPREQWERENEYGVSLKKYKQAALRSDNSGKKEKFDRPWDTAPPVHIAHGAEGMEGPVLMDGHHRLAHAEMHNIPYMAVQHHDWNDW